MSVDGYTQRNAVAEARLYERVLEIDSDAIDEGVAPRAPRCVPEHS